MESYQKNDPKYDISNVFEVNREDIRQVSNLLDQTSIQNKEVLLHVMAKVENKRQMCALKLHTNESVGWGTLCTAQSIPYM